MNATLHKCKACGKEYYHCDDCGEIGSFKKICCSEDCYSVFYVISRYLIDGDADKAANSLEHMGQTKDSGKKYIPSIASAIEKLTAKADIKEIKPVAQNRSEQQSKPKNKKTK